MANASLFLDDEASVASSAGKMLERTGYHVRSFTQPDEALEAVRNGPGQFDVVITDFNMPKMNGVELARRLHALRPDLPILVMSGYTAPVDPSQASARCSRSRSRRTRSRRRSASRSSGRPRILPGVDSSRPGEAGTCREHE
jgi:CheY-like chemotaxis protein